MSSPLDLAGAARGPGAPRSPRAAAALAAPVIALALGATGCFLDSSAYEAGGAGAAGPGGGGSLATSGQSSGGNGATHAGGSGGATTSGGTTAAAGSGGSTTTGTPECTIPSDCPLPQACESITCEEGACVVSLLDDNTPCGGDPPLCFKSGVCQAGACFFDFSPDNTPLVDSHPGDCQQELCDGGGMVKTKNDDADKPANTSCAEGKCAGGVPSMKPLTNDTDCGFLQTCQGGECCTEGAIDCNGCCYFAASCCGDGSCPIAGFCL